MTNDFDLNKLDFFIFDFSMDDLYNTLPLLIDYSKLDFSLPALYPLIEDLEFLY